MTRIVIHGKYRHFKGQEYTVLGTAIHASSNEELVIYQQEYGNYRVWARPVSEFLETVTRDGKTMPRFEHIGHWNPRVVG
jgi:hypothetical protein